MSATRRAPTPIQVRAARVRLKADRRLGRDTPESIQNVADFEESPRKTDAPLATWTQAEQLEVLRDAVTRLPQLQQQVVEGYFVHERSLADIAIDLGLSEAHVSQLRAEALVSLRRSLDEALRSELSGEASPSEHLAVVLEIEDYLRSLPRASSAS